MLQVKDREIGGCQPHLGDTGRKIPGQLHVYRANRGAQCPVQRPVAVVGDRNTDIEVGRIGTRQRQRRDHLGIEQAKGALGVEFYFLPDPRVAVAYCRNPVPALAGNECRAVDRKVAAVFTGPSGDRLLVRNSRMRWRGNPHGQGVLADRPEHVRHIEAAANERATDVAQTTAVEPGVGGVIDALECESDAPGRELCRRIKFSAVPIILAVQGLGDREIIEANIGIRVDTVRDQCRQDRPGHDRLIPVRIIEARRRQQICRRRTLAGRDQAPAPQGPCPGSAGFQCRGRCGQRRSRGTGGGLGARQRPRGLRLQQPAPCFFLPRPARADAVHRNQSERRRFVRFRSNACRRHCLGRQAELGHGP